MGHDPFFCIIYDLSQYIGIRFDLQLYIVLEQEGDSVKKVQIKYTFVNPNSTKAVERAIQQIVIEKILSLQESGAFLES